MKIKDGDLYKTIKIGENVFEIKYGYYEDFERDHNDPVPIYPDFQKNPVFHDGYRLVTAMQDVCEHFDGKDEQLGCLVCKYYEQCGDLIGTCKRE